MRLRARRRWGGATAPLAAAALFAMAAHGASDSSAPGLAEGTEIPAFEARDQHGEVRGFDSLAGKNGLLLVFFRSADW